MLAVQTLASNRNVQQIFDKCEYSMRVHSARPAHIVQILNGSSIYNILLQYYAIEP